MKLEPVQEALHELKNRGHTPNNAVMHPDTFDAITDVRNWFLNENGGFSPREKPGLYGLNVRTSVGVPKMRVVVYNARLDPRTYPGSIEVVYLNED